MKKYIVSVLLLSAGFSFASAQTADVDTSSDNSCAIITSNLRYLSRDANGSTDVSILQDFLSTRGYLKSQPTGFFGSATRRAVIAFQNDNGLRATPPGYVGPGTRAKIKEIDCNDTSAVNTAPVTTPITPKNTPTYTSPTAPVTNYIYQTASPSITGLSINNDGMGESLYVTGNNLSKVSVLCLEVRVDGEQCQRNFNTQTNNQIIIRLPQNTSTVPYELFVKAVDEKNSLTSNRMSITRSPKQETALDNSFTLLALTDIERGNIITTARVGNYANLCWKSGKDNKDQTLTFEIGAPDRKDQPKVLGSANLSKGCFVFNIPDLPGGGYVITARSNTSSLAASSPSFTLQGNTLDNSFTLLAPTDIERGNIITTARVGGYASLCWKSGKDNKDQDLTFEIAAPGGKADPQALGSAHLSQGCFVFVVPTNLPSGGYVVNAKSNSTSLFTTSPQFFVQGNQ